MDTIMTHRRRHKRYSLDLLDIRGKMSLSRKVNILDMSLGGVALKADRRLDLGREYMIKMQDNGKDLNVVGIVVRAELSEIEDKNGEQGISIYRAGMQFKGGSEDAVNKFLRSMVHTEKETAPSQNDQRHTVRFQITTPNAQILSYPADFNVRSISLGGMLVETEQALEVNSRVPMELALNGGASVKFIGRISSCRMKKDKGQAHYEIGSEFIDLNDMDNLVLKKFIDDWGAFLSSSEKDAA